MNCVVPMTLKDIIQITVFYECALRRQVVDSIRVYAYTDSINVSYPSLFFFKIRVMLKHITLHAHLQFVLLASLIVI
jgi:hypothetical protein